ncbi:MAG: hypothetical protein JNM24_03610 [Bdellovibrionaceae bacterium]|nr:hypothetical protein [Pseudobdellovibrionaceae bacterium]
MENKEEIKNKKSDDLAKIAISREADLGLGDIISKINDGFDGGKITKQLVTSYIVLDFQKRLNDSELLKIRQLFFDPFVMMEATLKKAKETGILPESVRDVLYQEFVNHYQSGKKQKKSLKTEGITDRHSESEAA